MTSQLRLYNGALLELGQRKLLTLDDEVEARYRLDDAWEDCDGVRFFLAQGDWKFATRYVEMTYSPSHSNGEFGYVYGFTKPEDWVRTCGVWHDDQRVSPIIRYADENDFLFCDQDTIYVAYVSDDDVYGGDLSLWLPTMARWSSLYLASRVCTALTHDEAKANALKTVADPAQSKNPKALTEARSQDARQGPTKFPPHGSWVRSRGRSHGYREG